MKNNITIIIPTFNRKQLVTNLLNTLLHSPLKQAPIIVLDNCSTDGTSETIQSLTQTHANISLIQNTYNMGLAGNLVKAMELAYTCKTNYFWILFDDTKLDFTYWTEVETYLQQNKPVIITTNYYQVTVDDLAPIFLMLIYPFAAIYQTRLLTPVILLKALTDIYTIHPQMAFLCELFNKKVPLTLASHNIALPSANPEKEYSFNRVKNFTHFRLSHPVWFVPGFLNAIEPLNKSMKSRCVELLFCSYNGEGGTPVGPYITKEFLPPIPHWNLVNLTDVLILLPFKYKIKFIKLLMKSSWRHYVQHK